MREKLPNQNVMKFDVATPANLASYRFRRFRMAWLGFFIDFQRRPCYRVILTATLVLRQYPHCFYEFCCNNATVVITTK